MVIAASGSENTYSKNLIDFLLGLLELPRVLEEMVEQERERSTGCLMPSGEECYHLVPNLNPNISKSVTSLSRTRTYGATIRRLCMKG